MFVACVRFSAALMASLLLAMPTYAELSARDCRAGDWRAIGYQHGRSGLPQDGLTTPASRCAELGFTADADALARGWHEGIADYCTEENGFKLGAQGHRYHNPCTAAYAADFRDGYQTGRQVHLAEAEIAELESMVMEISAELARIADAQQETETHLIRGDASPTERYRWLEETKYLARERAQAESELNSLDLEIESRKEHLELLRTSLAAVN